MIAAGCGGTPRRAPTQQDAVTIGAAVSDIVTQCQSVAAGFIAGPDTSALGRDVDALLRADRRVQPDARFVLGSSAGVTLATTLHKELSVAEENLAAGCSRRQAKRLQGTLGS